MSDIELYGVKIKDGIPHRVTLEVDGFKIYSISEEDIEFLKKPILELKRALANRSRHLESIVII